MAFLETSRRATLRQGGLIDRLSEVSSERIVEKAEAREKAKHYAADTVKLLRSSRRSPERRPKHSPARQRFQPTSPKRGASPGPVFASSQRQPPVALSPRTTKHDVKVLRGPSQVDRLVETPDGLVARGRARARHKGTPRVSRQRPLLSVQAAPVN